MKRGLVALILVGVALASIPTADALCTPSVCTGIDNPPGDVCPWAKVFLVVYHSTYACLPPMNIES